MAQSWRWPMVLASGWCYAAALTLPAFYESEGHRTYLGFECLLSPVTVAPVVLLLFPSWWANPVYACGLLALCRRWDAVAAAAGAGSALLALLFAAMVYDPYNQHVHSGFWFWWASMAIVGAAGLVGVLTPTFAGQTPTEEPDAAARLSAAPT